MATWRRSAPLDCNSAITPVIFIIILLSNAVDSLSCYKCSLTQPPPYSNETARLCSNFDYSARYVVECPYSTFCMKKHFTVNLTVPINGTLRDCANQRYDYQNYKNGKWELEVAIEEPYTEGCSKIDDKGFRSSSTTFCYCKGDLCNASNALQPTLALITVILAFTFL